MLSLKERSDNSSDKWVLSEDPGVKLETKKSSVSQTSKKIPGSQQIGQVVVPNHELIVRANQLRSSFRSSDGFSFEKLKNGLRPAVEDAFNKALVAGEKVSITIVDLSETREYALSNRVEAILDAIMSEQIDQFANEDQYRYVVVFNNNSAGNDFGIVQMPFDPSAASPVTIRPQIDKNTAEEMLKSMIRANGYRDILIDQDLRPIAIELAQEFFTIEFNETLFDTEHKKSEFYPITENSNGLFTKDSMKLFTEIVKGRASGNTRRPEILTYEEPVVSSPISYGDAVNQALEADAVLMDNPKANLSAYLDPEAASLIEEESAKDKSKPFYPSAALLIAENTVAKSINKNDINRLVRVLDQLQISLEDLEITPHGPNHSGLTSRIRRALGHIRTVIEFQSPTILRSLKNDRNIVSSPIQNAAIRERIGDMMLAYQPLSDTEEYKRLNQLMTQVVFAPENKTFPNIKEELEDIEIALRNRKRELEAAATRKPVIQLEGEIDPMESETGSRQEDASSPMLAEYKEIITDLERPLKDRLKTLKSWIYNVVDETRKIAVLFSTREKNESEMKKRFGDLFSNFRILTDDFNLPDEMSDIKNTLLIMQQKFEGASKKIPVGEKGKDFRNFNETYWNDAEALVERVDEAIKGSAQVEFDSLEYGNEISIMFSRSFGRSSDSSIIELYEDKHYDAIVVNADADKRELWMDITTESGRVALFKAKESDLKHIFLLESSSSPAIQDEKMKQVGGINLNPGLLDLQIKRDDNGIPLPVNLQPFHQMHIDGFVPVIINVTPVINLPLLLGFADGEAPFKSADKKQERETLNLSLADKYRNKYTRQTADDEMDI